VTLIPEKEIAMKIKKLRLHRETLLSLDDCRQVAGGAPVRTVDVTGCVTNCIVCQGTLTMQTSCC
jgi:hypothetical protein